MKAPYLQIGKITNIHGIMGEVRVQPWADSPEFLQKFKTLYVGDTFWPIEVLGARTHKSFVLLKLQGVTDVNSALAMRGQVLSIRREDAPLPSGHFFLADLMGLEARDAETDVFLGTVADVLTLPAHNVYVIRGGQREYLIPAVEQFIAQTDMEGGFLRVNLMEGL